MINEWWWSDDDSLMMIILMMMVLHDDDVDNANDVCNAFYYDNKSCDDNEGILTTNGFIFTMFSTVRVITYAHVSIRVTRVPHTTTTVQATMLL